MRAFALLCALCLLGASLAAAVVTHPAGATRSSSAHDQRVAPVIAEIDHYRQATWHWQHVMGLPKTGSNTTARHSPDPAYRYWVLRLWKQRARHVQAKASVWLVRESHAYEQVVSHWQRVLGVRPTPTRHTASASPSLTYRAWVYRLWRGRAQAILRKVQNPPHASQWRCIHHFEGSWRDAGAPYWGGLQMSLTFQRRYGGYLLRTKGTADHWTPLEQMWVADRALRSGRGFYPWPNTARMCGLI